MDAAAAVGPRRKEALSTRERHQSRHSGHGHGEHWLTVVSAAMLGTYAPLLGMTDACVCVLQLNKRSGPMFEMQAQSF